MVKDQREIEMDEQERELEKEARVSTSLSDGRDVVERDPSADTFWHSDAPSDQTATSSNAFNRTDCSFEPTVSITSGGRSHDAAEGDDGQRCQSGEAGGREDSRGRERR
jgi:hypothetical protein